MGKATTKDEETTSTEIVKTAEEIQAMLADLDNAQWDIVYDKQATQVKPDTLGDQLAGVLIRKEWITPQEINQKTGQIEEKDPFLILTFKGCVVGNQQQGPASYTYVEDAYVNAGHALEQAFKNIEVQTPVRMTLVNFRDVGEASPMLEWRVETPTRHG